MAEAKTLTLPSPTWLPFLKPAPTTKEQIMETTTIIRGAKTSEFHIPDIDIQNCNPGFISLGVSVTGFWSTPITIYIRRESAGKWSFSLTHSSGGMEGGEFDLLETELRFARALIESVYYIRVIQTEYAQLLEESYLSAIAKINAAFAKIAAEDKAALDADPALGIAKAKEIVKEICDKLESANPLDSIVGKLAVRGNPTAFLTFGGILRDKVCFKIGSLKISKKEMLQRLAESSHRTTFNSTQEA